MNPNPAQYQSASANPLFDEVARSIGPKPGRTLSPATTLSRFLERATAPSLPAHAAPAAVRTRGDRRVAAVSQLDASPAAVAPGAPTATIPTAAPLSPTDLTPAERELVTDMGGAVARLLVAMLRADQRSGPRA